ncbi:MAG TPA: beta-ketoacyl synthase N-terminal-like domain-containing protein [Acidiferrobacter sp.]|nr:beta-ketoacyl synthase N-terminal-like domain-containing protein [Acidiferrobacter sp.]
MTGPLFIRAAAAIGPQGIVGRGRAGADTAIGDLDKTWRELCGPSLRQCSRFVVAAVAGALLCTRKVPVAPETGLYFATGLGDTRSAAALFQQAQGGQGRASPFDFVNVNANTAAFHVARLVGLKGRNLTITQSELSFEWAARLAASDLQSGGTTTLLGGVDDYHPIDAEQRLRLALAADQRPGEGSAWLLLSKDPADALGSLLQISLWAQPSLDQAPWAQDVAARIADRVPTEGLRILPGFRVDAKQRADLQAQLPDAIMMPYQEHCGCFHTATAFAMVWALGQARGATETFAHITRDVSGHNGLVLFTAESGAGNLIGGAGI